MSLIVQGKLENGENYNQEIDQEKNYQTFYSKKLVEIDLTPLGKCSNLEKLGLNTNRLTSIDLTPLRRCKNLQILSMDVN